MFRVLSEKPDGARIASAPVPRNECDVGGKLVALHECEKLAVVDKSVRRSQEWIIDHQAAASFQRAPTCSREGPFNVENRRYRFQNMTPDVKNTIGQVILYIYDPRARREERRHAFIFTFQKDR